MATKSIIVLLLALTAFQGLNADTLLKRNVFDDFLNSTKNQIDEANQVLKNFADNLEQQAKLEEQKIAERINKIKDYFKNVFDRNSTTEKRSPILFTDIYKQIEGGINNFTSLANSSFGKRSPDFFSDIFSQFQQGISNLTSVANSTFGKRSPDFFSDIFSQFQQGISNPTSLANSTFGKRSPDFFSDIFSQFKQGISNITSLANSSFGKRSPDFFSDIFSQFQQGISNLTSLANSSFGKRSPDIFSDIFSQFQQGISNLTSLANSTFGKRSPDFFSDIFSQFEQGISNLTSLANSFGKRDLESKQKLEDFFKKFFQIGQSGGSQNTTVSSKRSITIDAGLSILNDLRSKLEAVVENVTQYFSNANSTSFLDKIRNVTSDFVRNRFNLTEISVDVSECLKAEENNVTSELEQRETQLEAIYANEKESAQPFLQNVSVTTPKIAKLVIAASLNASSCGQNYICLAIVAYNVYNQAMVLEPEVVQEVKAGWALAQSLAADAKVIEQQILSPAFSNMEAIGEETISCIEGKLDA